jgi:UV DNA damage endonuclease
MIMLENDDTTFTVKDTLYLCEKLGVPMVFDYHHHIANHDVEDWRSDWQRIIGTWKHSSLPIKMHISSPRSEKDFRAHADTIDPEMFLRFLHGINGTVPEIHCMIEAKQKDAALFQLVHDLKKHAGLNWHDQSSFEMVKVNG